MRAAVASLPCGRWCRDELIEERRRLGLDRRDEMRDGALHLVAPASSAHDEVGADLAAILWQQAKSRGLRRGDEPGVFDPNVPDTTSCRVPDRGYGRLQVRTPAGTEEV